MGPQALGVDTKLAGQLVKGIRALGEQGQGGPQALVAVRRALGVHSPSPLGGVKVVRGILAEQ